MSGAAAFATSERAFAGASTPASPACLRTVKSMEQFSSVAQPLEGNTLGHSLVNSTTAFKRGEHSKTAHISTTNECSDWLRHTLRQQSAKAIAADCGIGTRAAEGIKAGRNGLTMAHLVTMCRANPDFRAAFFNFCGGQLEGDPELVAQLSKAINAVMQNSR